jgi:hypothetical protein
MRKTAAILIGLVALAAVVGCKGRTDRSDGTVILSVSDFNGLPVGASVNTTQGILSIDTITIQNLAKNPDATTSSLMNVEMRSYEVVYSRVDGGTRVPTSLVRSIFGVAPVNGNIVYNNLPVAGSEQFDNPPLSDLQFINGGTDSETGRQVIILKLTIRFFGRTLTGDEVATDPIRFDVEFSQ